MENQPWVTIEYIRGNGEVPIENFLDSLPVKHEAKVLRSMQLLEKYTNYWYATCQTSRRWYL